MSSTTTYQGRPTDDPRLRTVDPTIVQRIVENEWYVELDGECTAQDILSEPPRGYVSVENLRTGEMSSVVRARYDDHTGADIRLDTGEVRFEVEDWACPFDVVEEDGHGGSPRVYRSPTSVDDGTLSIDPQVVQRIIGNGGYNDGKQGVRHVSPERSPQCEVVVKDGATRQEILVDGSPLRLDTSRVLIVSQTGEYQGVYVPTNQELLSHYHDSTHTLDRSLPEGVRELAHLVDVAGGEFELVGEHTVRINEREFCVIHFETEDDQFVTDDAESIGSVIAWRGDIESIRVGRPSWHRVFGGADGVAFSPGSLDKGVDWLLDFC